MTDFPHSPDPRPTSRDALIAALTEDVTPVRRVHPAQGYAAIALACVVAAIASVGLHDFWSGLLTGEASGFFWITNGLLLVLGVASAVGLVAGALPRVGARGNAPAWSAAMLAVVPFTGLLVIATGAPDQVRSAQAEVAVWQCAAYALLAGSLVAGAAIAVLRRGAPVSLERSGWLTGLAAGALGSIAYGITCPIDGVAHVGIVHVVPVAIAAVIGRLVVPPLIRW